MRFATLLLACGLAGCQTSTIVGTYRVSVAEGRQEKTRALLRQFAAAEGMQPMVNRPVTLVSGVPPFAAYETSPVPGITVEGYVLPDAVQARLTEHREFGRLPTGRYEQLAQKLQHRFWTTFGSETRHTTEYLRGAP